MSGFKFSPNTPDGLPLQPLGDPTLKDVASAEARFDGAPEFQNIAFTFDAGANGFVRVCNSVDDEHEEDGVLGVPPGEGTNLQGALAPPLVFDEGSAWLKYRVEAHAKGSVGAKFPVGAAGFESKIEAGGGVTFGDYRRHDPGEQTALAIVADAAQPRVVFRADDALLLGEQDALFYRVHGELSAGVTLKWADVFTASLGKLSELLRSGEVLALQFDAGAEVNFQVGVRDDFRLVLTKGAPLEGAERTVRVSVFKSKASELGVGVKLVVQARFADEDAARAALTKAYEGLAGPLIKDVDGLFAEIDKVASLEALPEEARGLAEILMARLGLNPQSDTLEELKGKWAAVKEKVPVIIEQVATAKVEVGFTYEYLRVRTDETLLQADLDEAAFRRFHPDLLVFGLDGLTDWLRDEAPKEALKKYFRQESVKRTQTWGFNLGISPWGVKVGGTDKLEETRIVQKSIDKPPRQRMAYDGLRSYVGRWMEDTVTFAADFKAEMQKFSAGPEPETCEFEYGLSLKWEWDEKALTAAEFESILDHAQLWQVVQPRRAAHAVKAVEDRFGQSANVRLEMTLDQEALLSLLPRLVNPPPPAFNAPARYADFDSERKLETWGAEALAAAMPYAKEFEARRNSVLRQTLYAPLWRRYFEDDSLPFSQYREIAFQNIPRLSDKLGLKLSDDEGLAANERQKDRPQFTFAGMIELHQGVGNSAAGIHRNWQSFARGLQRLAEAARPNNCQAYENVEKSFNDMARFFSQSLYLRALGYFFAEVSQRSALTHLVKRTLTVTYGDEEAISIG